mgnify:FL=1
MSSGYPNFTIKAKTFNELYPKLIRYVYENGMGSAPRGMKTRELVGLQFCLEDPTAAFCTIKSRKLNHRFAIIEAMEYASGLSDPTRLCSYNKNMKRFVNSDTGEFDGAYAPRIGAQINYIFELLKQDPDSRQAVININQPIDKHISLDITCTISLQFLLRDKKLDLIATMRSNDLLWGTPYDVHGFCLIQQMMAVWLGVGLGLYIHQAASAHIYLDRFDQLDIVCRHKDELIDLKIPVFDVNHENASKQFRIFWDIEKSMRCNDKVDQIEYNKLSPSFQQYIDLLRK